MWKGVIKFGKDDLPVKLYAAAQESSVHFHLLHDKDEVRVQQRIVRPDTEEAVPNEEIRKGYPLPSGGFVLLTKSEIKELAPKASRDVELEACVPATSIAPAWFERPYYVGPDGDAKAYAALVEALANTEQQAIVRWVMRGKRYTGALRAQGDHLVLISLRDREEVIETPRIQIPKNREPSAQEVALAKQLVATLEGEFDPSQFKSEYRERVMDLIERKASGKRIKLVKPQARKSTGSLESMLKASVKQSGSSTKQTANHAARGSHKERKSA